MSHAVGRPIERVDARAKVTGAAPYAADTAVDGVTHGVLVMSTIARGRVTAVDTGAAQAAPGVLAVFTHTTMPRLTTPRTGYFKRFVPLQDDQIRHAGQPVALVVAETLEEAQEAAALVRVGYAPQAVQVVMADALDEAYVPPFGGDGPTDHTRGDAAAGRAQAEVTVDATYTTVLQYHNPMEPSVTVAAWDGDRLTVHDSTQGITFTRQSLAQALDVPAANVRVVCPYVGGGFGAKGPVWHHTLLTAAAARSVGRPVKLVLTRADSYTSTGHRPETHQQLTLGARRDGRLTVIEHITTEQVSRTEEILCNPHAATLQHYACPNLHAVQRAVRLDLPTGTYTRAPGTTTVHALECALDELAYALDLDPIELRLRNDTQADPDTGEPYGSRYLAECFDRGAELFGWAERDPTPGSMGGPGGLVGWGVASVSHTAGSFSGGIARATLTADGTALVQCGTQDIGTGTYTVMTQVGAESLGMPVTSVRAELGDSDLPAAPVSAASSTTAATVPAVGSACTTARDQVIQLAVDDPDSPLHGRQPGQIDVADGYLFVTADPDVRDSYAAVIGRHGSPVVVNSQPQSTRRVRNVGAVFAEVLVHPVLGTVRVRRVVAVYDPGTVLNPRTARSQAVGGITWSIGFALSEHTLVDSASGRVVNPNLSGYVVAGHSDVPDLQVEFIDQPDPSTPATLGARGFGETPTTGASAAIVNAVYHATGRRVRDLPLTPDQLL